MVQRELGEHFRNWLMSGGYRVYRDLDHRLRCLARLNPSTHCRARRLSSAPGNAQDN